MAAQDLSSSRIIQQLNDILLLFVIVGDDCKILSLPISQAVGCFTILLL